MDTTDQTLLSEFAMHRSEEAFAELVNRHLDMVHSAATRLAAQGPVSAEDITQQVFVELARQAGRLRERVVLEPWLYTTTRFVASNMRRAEARRRKREMEFSAMNNSSTTADDDSIWNQTAGVLEDAMDELGNDDRTAVLLRFFRQYDFRSIGQALNLSDDGARMRVNRALEKLRHALLRRGIQTSTATLAAILGAHAISAAPAALATSITSAALTLGSASGVAASSGTLAFMTMTNMKIGLVSALIIGGVSTPLIMQQREISRMRQETAALRQQSQEFALIRAENKRLSNYVAKAKSSPSLPTDQLSDLMKLRALVTQLRRDSAELAQLKSTGDDAYVKSALDWKARVETLKQGIQQMPDHRIPQLQLLSEDDWFETAKNANLETEVGYQRALGFLRSRARGHLAGLMSVALKKYVTANDGRLPEDTIELSLFFPTPLDPAILQQYQMLRTGALSEIPQGAWLISERQPLQHGFDSTFRVGYDRLGVEQNGPMEKALGEFFAANPGKQPQNLAELKSFIPDEP